jgi:hypothetical protein
MQAISRTELQDQAAAFAHDMVAFLNEQSSQYPNPRGPLAQPQESAAGFEHHFMQFVARWRVVTP